MWKASLLLAAVRADFDDAMVAAGQRGQRRAHKAGPALLDVLRVPVRTGCALTYAAGKSRSSFRRNLTWRSGAAAPQRSDPDPTFGKYATRPPSTNVGRRTA